MGHGEQVKPEARPETGLCALFWLRRIVFEALLPFGEASGKAISGVRA